MMETKLEDSHFQPEKKVSEVETKHDEANSSEKLSDPCDLVSSPSSAPANENIEGQSSPSNDNQEAGNNTADLFIGDLPKELTERDIADTFTKYGEIVQLLIKRAKVTKVSLGYGFVKYKNHDDAINAYNELRHGCYVDGKEIRVGWAQRNCKIHVGNLEPSVTVEDLNREFGEFGDLITSDTCIHRQGM